MKVQQLEQLYRDGINRMKEQMKRQEKERMEQMRRQIREEQKEICEKKLADAREAENRELRLLQEELNRIIEQSVSLQERIDELMEKENSSVSL